MRIVSSNSAADIACHRAKDRVAEALRELAANMLRVTRGAGRSYELKAQAEALTKAMQDHWDACGVWPSSDELDRALSIAQERDLEALSDREYEWASSQEKMVRGALQVAASTLLGQRTQRAAGQREMFDGLTGVERIRAENRRAGRAPAFKGSTDATKDALERARARAARPRRGQPKD